MLLTMITGCPSRDIRVQGQGFDGQGDRTGDTGTDGAMLMTRSDIPDCSHRPSEISGMIVISVLPLIMQDECLSTERASCAVRDSVYAYR
jgi:hypothetical protein